MQHIKILSLTAEVAVGLLKNNQDEIKWVDIEKKQVFWRTKKDTKSKIQEAEMCQIAPKGAIEQGYGIVCIFNFYENNTRTFLIEASMDKVKNILEKH